MNRIEHVLFATVVTAIASTAILHGCGALKPACLVIDAAHAACAVLVVPDGRGGTEEVRLSREEVVALAQQVKASRRDAGAP